MEQSLFSWLMCTQEVNTCLLNQTLDISQMNCSTKDVYHPQYAIEKARDEGLRHKHLPQTHEKPGE